MAKAKKKSDPSKPQISKSTHNRRLDPGQYKSFHLQKRIKHSKPKLNSAFRIFRNSVKLIGKNWKLFGSISLVYLLLTIGLVQGFGSSAEMQELKTTLQTFFGGAGGQLAIGLTLFSELLKSTGTTPSELAGAYQSMLLVIMSLALIWALRQVLAKEKISLRDVFYRGMYPLIPFLLVLGVISLELLIMAAGNYIYSSVVANGLATTLVEKIIWLIVTFLLVVLSLYLITSSVFAMYIVTLPDMRPMQALRSARELVRYRRLIIMRKILFLPFILIITMALITIPIILFLTPIAEGVFFILTIFGLTIIHSYMYHLYRELL